MVTFRQQDSNKCIPVNPFLESSGGHAPQTRGQAPRTENVREQGAECDRRSLQKGGVGNPRSTWSILVSRSEEQPPAQIGASQKVPESFLYKD